MNVSEKAHTEILNGKTAKGKTVFEIRVPHSSLLLA
jgi:hypothetical protein